MNSAQTTIFSLVQMQLASKNIICEDDIESAIHVFRIINPITDEEAVEIKKELLTALQIKMDVGACLKEKNHVSWYYNAKKDIHPVFWERYKKYLNKDQGLSTKVISTMDIATDEMMDMLGDPRQKEGYSRKGLIIGDVQSGKTSTYTALINKAADSGYKIIILLTGTIEKLRKQTQGRLDAGFIGLDSSSLVKDKKNVYIGVGNIDPSISGWSITSTTNDFNKNAAQQFNGQLKSIQSPVLFVLKKNKSTLEQLYEWLRAFNANADGKILSPMLLIDDEADNASVNTRKEDDSPTAINKGIRKLLGLFTHSNYVAFTATPYANIFINPDSDDEMLKDDLFPSDFIYALEAPTNYIGAERIFADDGKYHFMLKNNTDCQDYIPEKHKKDYVPGTMPASLKEAVVSFFISNAIRDLRGQEKKHRTMLINISRFIAVQEKIKDDVEEYVRDFQTEIRNYCSLGKRALTHENIAYIKYVYDKHFASLSEDDLDGEKIPSWEDVQEALDDAVSPIVVRTVNGGNAAKNLNYDDNEEEGLRLIAVGGFSLSRGLTLEGLCTSYFYRNSKMYDTLMQMGRWFGYRSHYADLCQVWMSDESVSWYSHISMASEELKKDVRRMTNANMTPKEFGLCVRSDINTLLVTAVNKMRYTHTVPVTVGLDGSTIDTPNFYRTHEKNKVNYDVVTEWLTGLISSGYSFADNSGQNLALNYPQILNVKKENIIELLKTYDSHYWNLNFRTEDIIKALTNSDSNMDSWDVLIACGTGKQQSFGPVDSIKPITRQFYIPDPSKDGISIAHHRISNVNYAKGGLTKEQAAAIEKAAIELRPDNKKDSNFSETEYFNSGIKRNPLLVVLPVLLTDTDADAEIKKNKANLISEYRSADDRNLWVGIEIGIPSIDGKKRVVYTYTINMIKYRELLGVEDDYYEETGDEDLND